MDTTTLKYWLNRLLSRCNARTYVCAKNEINIIDVNHTPWCAIINTEPSSVQDRGHWIAVVSLSDGQGSFFCSFNGTPEEYGIRLPGITLTIASKAFQNENSTVCGIYALQFCILLIKGYSVWYFHNLYSTSNTLANDRKVLSFYNKQTRLKLVQRSGQTCCCKNSYLEKCTKL